MVDRYGYEKARRIGVVAMVGGKNKTAIRNATPEPFRDVLLAIARQAHNKEYTAAIARLVSFFGAPYPAPLADESIANREFGARTT